MQPTRDNVFIPCQTPVARAADGHRWAAALVVQPLKSMVRWLSVAAALVAAIVAGYLIFTFPHPSPQAPTTFNFLSYTNTGGQMEALFRLDHPPRPVRSDGIWELRYRTSAGWVRPSAPTVSFGCFGWDGTGSLVAISVETTNLPARVVMDIWTRRKGIRGLYDRLMDGWTKLVGKTPELRGDVLYLTNQTTTLPSNP